ncbi:MAG: DsrE family protein [Gammaproteobacteria bacterium]|nr:DsrE family protein [Gammaproteobacteria bacterium]MDH5803384.1 DsrE family protein [Gammaproteobacteria bacterium]
MIKPGYFHLIVLLLCLHWSTSLWAQSDSTNKTYKPAKVTYDVSTADPKQLAHLLDRINLLQTVYNHNSFDASIVLVIHEGAIPLFTKKYPNQEQLMQRARGLSLGEMIEFRICEASAKQQGIGANDLHNFVILVPMADAELVQLQTQGYAYLKDF